LKFAAEKKGNVVKLGRKLKKLSAELFQLFCLFFFRKDTIEAETDPIDNPLIFKIEAFLTI
jgi:hypothetical protein